MPKNKLHKYERVLHLPNVTFSVFGRHQPMHEYPWHGEPYGDMEKVLELGCGKGEHSLAFAAADPGRLCVGIDSKSYRMCVGAEKAIAMGLDNVLFLRARIEHLKAFFMEGSIHQIWLTFPDPHPKKRAVKCRLSAPLFLDAYAHVLVPHGTVNLKTDSDLLYNYTLESVTQWGGRVVAASDNIHRTDDGTPAAQAIVSSFENKALSQGKTIKYIAFTLN